MDTKHPQGQEKCLCDGGGPTPILPKVTRIIVARLYNLGNYEHKRIEVEISIPEQCRPSKALIEIESILDSLDFNDPSEQQDYKIRSLQERAKWTDEQWREQRGTTWEKDKADEVVELEQILAEAKAWREEQDKQRLLLDSIGAVEV